MSTTAKAVFIATWIFTGWVFARFGGEASSKCLAIAAGVICSSERLAYRYTDWFLAAKLRKDQISGSVEQE